MHNNRRLALFFFHNLPVFMKSTTCGETSDDSKMPNFMSGPLPHRVTIQILKRCQSFRDLKLTFTVSHCDEQFSLLTQQRIITTAEDSVLRTEMTNLEFQEGDDPKRVLSFKPMSLLGIPVTSQR